MYIRQGIGQMFGGATLPFARGRGAQSALLAARAREAHALGCRWLVAETGAETPGTHNSSLHNMMRMGFTALYQRQNWTWRSAASGFCACGNVVPVRAWPLAALGGAPGGNQS